VGALDETDCAGVFDGDGVAEGLDCVGKTVASAGLAAGAGVARADGAAPGASALVEAAGMANEISTPHTNPNATLTMIRGAL
jgi:hypothetical protein